MRNLSRRSRLAEPPPTDVLLDAPPRRARAGRSRSARLALSASALAIAGVVGLGAGAAPALAADDCANAEFRTGWSAQLPDCRAYELVSPADKVANSLNFSLMTSAPSASTSRSRLMPSLGGNEFFIQEGQSFGDPHGMGGSHLVVVRGAAGWQTTNIAPPSCKPDSIHGLTTPGWNRQFLSADMRVASYVSSVTPGGVDLGCNPDDQAGIDVYRVGRDGDLDWISGNGAPKTVDVNATAGPVSADGSHMLFTTAELLTPQDVGRTTGAGLYDHTGGRAVPVGLTTAGNVVNACGAAPAGDFTTPWQISRDGRVIFFASGTNAAAAGCKTTDGGGQLYARIDANRTVELSASQLAVPAATKVPAFLGATSDGRRVYFKSTERLTDDADATGGLYEYDLSPVLAGTSVTGTLRFLSPSVDGNAANVHRLVRVVGDGEQVYFLAGGVLVPGAASTGRKLYRASHGQVDVAVQLESASLAANFDLNRLSISPDGSKIVFQDQTGGQPYPQIYLIDRGAPSGGVVCVSCPSPGQAASGPGTLLNTNNFAGSTREFGVDPYVTNDGRVFFGSPERLAAGDQDNYYDVYEYRAGQRNLVTPGTATTHATLIGVGPDGRDVFFATGSSLVARDFDNGDLDVYSARVGGGFPQPAPAPAPCTGDACQGVAPPSSPGVLPSTTWFRGLGNVPAPAPGQQRDESDEDEASKPRVSKVKSVRGTSTRIRVRVSGEGRIRTSGSGLRRSHKTAKSEKAKTYAVSVRLSSRAKRTLDRKGRIRVRVTVRFTPEEGKSSFTRVNVTFRKKKSKSSSRAKERSRDGASRATGKDGR